MFVDDPGADFDDESYKKTYDNIMSKINESYTPNKYRDDTKNKVFVFMDKKVVGNLAEISYDLEISYARNKFRSSF